jgi:dipeptidyl aminopeptidase/acylaminoacyl peptidase
MQGGVRTVLLVAGLAAGVAGGCGREPAAPGAGDGAPVPQYTVAEFMATTSLDRASFSADGTRVLVSSDESGVYNAAAYPVNGGPPAPLTRSTTDAVLVNGYFPADDRFLYSGDRGGNELTHLFVQTPDGTAVDLTPGEKHKAAFLGWATDDRSFFLSLNDRDPRFFDIYEVAIPPLAPGGAPPAAAAYGRTLLYRDATGYEFAAISPDRRLLAFNKPRTTFDSDIYLYDRTERTMKHLTPHTGDVIHAAESFTPDGSALYLATDEGSEFRWLARLDLASGRREVVEKPDWDVWYASFSHGGHRLVVGINNDARTDLRIYEATPDGSPARLRRLDPGDLPPGDVTSVVFSRDEKRMALYLDGNRAPKNLFVVDLLDGKDSRPRQITRTLNPKIDPAHLVDAQVVRFKSYDGVEIPGLLYRPRSASDRAKAPAIVWVHGGPGDQARVGYSGFLQALVNRGYVVYAINNRGSSGYGKTFYRMDDRRHGDADLRDCIASKAFLVSTGYVDPQRIGIAGGSYGGYMVLAALAFHPEEFAVGVDIFGVANWVRTLKEIPAWWESFRQALYTEIGDPAKDEEYLRKISPLFAAQDISRPLIVLQGANDPRVKKIESDEMVAAARAGGTPVEYIVFDDEGHGFRRKENRVRGYQAILDFLDTHLKGQGERTPL